MPISSYTHKSYKPKVVVVMGPTGCGKTKLSIDLASRFFPCSEIINSDKIQAYPGLHITTNKVPLPDRRNIPHHLLGHFHSTQAHPEFTPSDFRSAASAAVSAIISRGGLPFLVGGSTSFIYALLANKFEEDRVMCRELRYNCCFIWLDVAFPVLNRYLIKRVDDMLESGMFQELGEYLNNPPSHQCGLTKAIGVPEFQGYFTRFKINGGDEEERRLAYDEAVRAIKENTCRLAQRQVGKILRLRDCAGWDLNRVDTTPALMAAMEGVERTRVAEIWETEVVEPSVNIVKQFLMD